MYQTCTSLLTSAVLLTHTVLGCCWHSPGGCEEGCSHAVCAHDHTTDEAVGTHEHACHHHGQVGRESSDQQSSPVPVAPCSHGKCSYVVSKAFVVSSANSHVSQLESWSRNLVTDSALSVQFADRNAISGAARQEDDADSHAARARARLQIWLI